MSEQAVAVVEQPRTRMVVADVVPIFDTARFEHYGRIAAVIARTRMMPDSLCKEKVDGKDVWLDMETITARSFRIVALADRWNCDPFQLMGACSFVHNQLMIEGKVIHGVVDSELGIILDYQFGLWNPKQEITLLDQLGEGDAMAVRVLGTLGGEDVARYVDGSVGIWKTTGNNTPWKPGGYRRMLRYRGAREWTRAYKPSLLIGIIGDDEFDEYRDRRDVVQAAPIGLDPGFPREALQAPQTPAKPEPPKRTSAKRKAPEAPQGGQDEGKSSGGGDAEYVDPDTGQVFDSQEALLAAYAARKSFAGDEVIEGESRVVQDAEQGSDTKGSATDASDAAQDQTASGPQAQDGPSSDGDDDFPGDRKPGQKIASTEGQDVAQGGAAEEETRPHPFVEALGKVANAPHWDAIKQAVRPAASTETWRTDTNARTTVRQAMFQRYCDLRDQGETVIPVNSDMTLMGLWLDYAADSIEAIDAVWRGFFRNPAYTQAGKDDQKAITEKMVERKTALGKRSG